MTSSPLSTDSRFEREILRERVRAGLAHARQNGQRLGRPLTAALHADQVRKLYLAGTSKASIARRLNIGRTSVRRIPAATGDEMSTKRIWLPQEIYQIKVSLLGTRPPIWRRLLVPAGLTLEVLHDVLQIAMGWDGSHLHEFRVGQKQFGEPHPNDGLMGLPAIGDERTVRLFTVLGRVGAKAVYTYDFGDSWEHAILVEKVLPPEPGVAYPICVGGKLQGPPEDCGGVPGYYNLLEALCDPDHPEHEEMLDWVGGEFNPDAFSAEDVNRRLSLIQRWWAKT